VQLFNVMSLANGFNIIYHDTSKLVEYISAIHHS